MQKVEVRIKGFLGQDWSSWFANLSVANTVDGHTIISGVVRDQAALYGLLERLSALGIHLVSVTVKSPAPGKGEEVKRM